MPPPDKESTDMHSAYSNEPSSSPYYDEIPNFQPRFQMLQDSPVGQFQTEPTSPSQFYPRDFYQPESGDDIEATPSSPQLQIYNASVDMLQRQPDNLGNFVLEETGNLQPPLPEARGVRLVEVIAQDAVQRSAKKPSGKADTLADNRNRKFGTLRTMSMRGVRPTRIVKEIIVAKSDPKSYFSNERTMYAWIYIATVILGISLSAYAYQYSTDIMTHSVALNGATFLSGLSLVVVFYGAGHFYWRRKALQRMDAATAFDDRLGPYIIVTLLCAGLAFNEYLRWTNHTIGLNTVVHSGASFGSVKPTGPILASNGTQPIR